MDTNNRYYTIFAIVAVGLGGCGAMEILLAGWSAAFLFYACATFARLCAGWVMNRIVGAETVSAWNNQYHRAVVIVLNSVVGAVLFARLAWDTFQRHTHIGMFALFGAVFIIYFYAACLTRPNTFAARVRSAALTVALIVIMAHLAFAVQWFYLALGSAMVLGGTWGRLRQLQRRLGWPNM